MKRLSLYPLLAIFLLIAGLSMTHATEKNGVVIQVSDNDPAKWNLALNNARNIQNALGKDNVDVEIVAYGPGIDMLKMDSAVGNRLRDATSDGIGLKACQNTMKGKKLNKEDMHQSVGYVESGVVEIMKRQKEGWSYLRP